MLLFLPRFATVVPLHVGSKPRARLCSAVREQKAMEGPVSEVEYCAYDVFMCSQQAFFVPSYMFVVAGMIAILATQCTCVSKGCPRRFMRGTEGRTW